MIDPALKDKHIVLGVAAGIAAYKAVELVRLLTKAGAQVQVVMTDKARHFIGELTFQTLTGKPVFFDLFDLSQESEIGHIQVADRADLVIIAPATANTIARLASGMATDALSSVVLASRAPLLLAPSMNVNMWNHPLTQANVRRLVELCGAAVVGPGDGFLACRWTGPGRLAEPADICEAAARTLTRRDLAGQVVAVSAGPTHEAIDPVRFLCNRSSGKMGYAVARAASRRGAEVTLVSGPVALPPPPGVDLVSVRDARAMDAAMREAARSADVVVMAAAVADFRPRQVAGDKLDKGDLLGAGALTIELEQNPDVLFGLGQDRADAGATRPLLVGFAAETRDLIERARGKLARKQCDLIVANDVSEHGAGFEVDTNRVALVCADGVEHIELASKDAIAHRILDRVVAMLAAASAGDSAPG
ncbi:bifunctional phosphopantothenoylcysteine decarboxylase/phosphopantothenate--cysteine ligase CoaBC [Haliangium sp.]|uniref:bifunctional phosphopantothenoylcysteine decarboxylase/phosphopantothenate--cysteine ligase CoaBC n=1 Tax=Haliangium sp. TaxID=2663208 RepID=UPI003D129FD8